MIVSKEKRLSLLSIQSTIGECQNLYLPNPLFHEHTQLVLLTLTIFLSNKTVFFTGILSYNLKPHLSYSYMWWLGGGGSLNVPAGSRIDFLDLDGLARICQVELIELIEIIYPIEPIKLIERRLVLN